MTDERSFLWSVCEQPGEDTPRLAYADWLDENDQPERAEFIRVQCGLAHAKVHPQGHTDLDGAGRPFVNVKIDCKRDDCPACPLRRRERELLLDNWKAWIPRFPNGDTFELILSDRWAFRGVPAVAFHRGFVAEVRCELATLLGTACDECAGPDDGLHAVNAAGRCAACDGKKRTAGVGVEIFRAHPIERVVVMDKGPMRWTPDSGSSPVDQPDRFSWINEEKQRGMGTPERRRVMLPGDIFREVAALPGAEVRFDEYARYDTPEAATDALSAAVVSLLRVRAGLPQLETQA